MKMPDKIYLQIADGDERASDIHAAGITWYSEPIDQYNVEYVLKNQEHFPCGNCGELINADQQKKCKSCLGWICIHCDCVCEVIDDK